METHEETGTAVVCLGPGPSPGPAVCCCHAEVMRSTSAVQGRFGLLVGLIGVYVVGGCWVGGGFVSCVCVCVCGGGGGWGC